MHLAQLKISSYKSFFEPKEFKFEPGFNVLLGANSSGKSSVLESIAYHAFEETPHRSILNSTEFDVELVAPSLTELSFSVALNEIDKLVEGRDIYIGLGEKPGHFYSEDLHLIKQRLLNESLQLDFKIGTGRFARLSFSGWPSAWRNINSSHTASGFHVHLKNSKLINIEIAKPVQVI